MKLTKNLKTRTAGSCFKTNDSPVTVHLCTWLKRARLEKNYSMRVFSEILGVPHSLIGKVENRERRLDVAEFVAYCEALGIKPEDGILYAKSEAAKEGAQEAA